MSGGLCQNLKDRERAFCPAQNGLSQSSQRSVTIFYQMGGLVLLRLLIPLTAKGRGSNLETEGLCWHVTGMVFSIISVPKMVPGIRNCIEWNRLASDIIVCCSFSILSFSVSSLSLCFEIY